MMFRNLPLTEPETVKRLYQQVKFDKSARDEMIRQHMRLAIHIAKYMSPCKPEIPEYVAEAMLALVSAVESMDCIENGQPTHFIARSIRNQLRDLRIKNQLFYISRGAYHRRTENGQDQIEVILVGSASSNFGISTPSTTETDELVSLCGLTDKEKMILEYRLAGFNDPEIGELMNYSRKTIWKMRQGIGEKYKRLGDQDGTITGRGQLESGIQSTTEVPTCSG